jgi:transcriptional regulator with XRE-family HTH domain
MRKGLSCLIFWYNICKKGVSVLEEKEVHLVKRVCKEYGMTQIELAKELDIPIGTISRWVSTNNIPRTAELALNLMLKNRELENKIEYFKLFRDALNKL